MNTVPLHHTSLGEGEPPLVLLHGYTGSSLDWADVAPQLAKGRRVLTFDHRGHGESPNVGTPEGYSFDLLVADFVAAVKDLGLPPFHLLGHSMGGVVAMRVATEHPELLESLILMDTSPYPAGRMPLEAIEGIAAVGREQGMPAVLAIVATMAEQENGEASAPAATGEKSALKKVREERVAIKFSQLDVEAFVSMARELNGYASLVPRLSVIAVPTTVLIGERDTGLIEGSEVMAKEIPGAEYVVIPDAGHSPQEDQPAAWIAAVEAHLSRV